MSKEEKIITLLSDIGEIDDIFVKEASSYKRRPKRNLWIPIVAACLALCVMATALLSLSVMIPLGIVVIGNSFNVFDGFMQDQSPEFNNSQENTEEVTAEKDENSEFEPNAGYVALDLIFDDKIAANYGKVESLEQLSYDEASIIWQNSESGEFFVETLTRAEIESVKRNMGKGKQVGESSPEITYRVWIVDENRVVSSPYLESGAGSQSFAIFDYEAEIIPNDELIECISDILK